MIVFVFFILCSTFFANFSYAKLSDGPIQEPVVLRLNKSDGSVIYQWGDGL
jgi:hypothetical protein